MSSTRFAILTVLAMAANASADPRAEAFQKQVVALDEKCGSKITATYDIKSELAGREAGTGYEYCGEIVDAVADVCSDDDAKAILVAKLKTVSCKMEAGSTKKMNDLHDKNHGGKYLDVNFANGTLTAVFDFSSSNLGSETSRYLGIALGINDARDLKHNQKAFAKAIDDTNEKCGSKFTATYDFSSELTAERPPDRDNGNGYTFCVNVLEGIGNVCSMEAKKGLVAKKLKAVTCKMEHGSSKKMSALTAKAKEPKFLEVSFKKGTLSTVFDWNTANVAEEVLAFLGSAL